MSHTHPKKFSDFLLHDSILKDVTQAGYETPTAIQAECIAPVMEGKDLIGLAQTGTGKTAAFALPIIHRVAQKNELGAVVLAPTRELARQITEQFEMLGRSSGIRVAMLVGGVNISQDHRALRGWPNVVVATPGRLIDHIQSRTIVLKDVRILTVDEADRMHDMGFMPQIRRIIAALPKERQTLMFTATMPKDVEHIARGHMKDPVRIQIGLCAPVDRAEQQLFHVQPECKTPLLMNLVGESEGRVLIFMRTRRGVERLAKAMLQKRHNVARLHSDRTQPQRDDAMAGFRNGKYRILIATDIAARGIDVADIEHVINYDFPACAEDYIHRIGRTARVAATGRATSFVTGADRDCLARLERVVGTRIEVTPSPIKPSPETKAIADEMRRGGRREEFHGQRRGSGPRPHGGGARSSGHGASRGGSHGGSRGSSYGRPHGASRGRSQSQSHHRGQRTGSHR
jgi:ATP-dependent RNA helicase RhlE